MFLLIMAQSKARVHAFSILPRDFKVDTFFFLILKYYFL